MQLLPIKRATLVEKLVAEVRSEITSGRLQVGQRLPTEAKMAAQFGVSRPLLREALAELRAEGFVQTESGRGTFVRHPRRATWPTLSATNYCWRCPARPRTSSTKPAKR